MRPQGKKYWFQLISKQINQEVKSLKELRKILLDRWHYCPLRLGKLRELENVAHELGVPEATFKPLEDSKSISKKCNPDEVIQLYLKTNSLSYTGKQLGLSRERVRQIVAACLKNPPHKKLTPSEYCVLGKFYSHSSYEIPDSVRDTLAQKGIVLEAK